MIMQNLALILAVLIPVALVLVLRSNGPVIFLSLCAGSVLVRFVGNDAGLVGSALGNNASVASSYSQLGLLLIPPVLSLFFLRHSIRGSKVMFNILPALAVGLVGVLLAVPLLPGGVRHDLTSTNGWSILLHQQELVVIAGSLVSLIVLWLAPQRQSDKKHHKH
jgi:hypothetical protein